MKIAVLGATGAVGREMLKVLLERGHRAEDITALASARSAGKTIEVSGHSFAVREAKEDAFAGLSLVLGAASADAARQLAPAITAAGAVFVDNSSAFRLNADVPLVVPEINPQDALAHRGIISNPNCSTIISLMALYPLKALSPITSLVASTYQAVSGAGAAGLQELEEQVEAYAAHREITHQAFPHQIAFNLIPAIGSGTDNGYTTEEMKMQNEGRKILHLPDMRVSCTCVRVPVFRSHAISLVARFERKIPVDEARAAIVSAKGVRLVDDLPAGIYPMPLDTSDQDIVYVGRVREDLTDENGLALWCSGDQIRKGAATNAVQIAELIL